LSFFFRKTIELLALKKEKAIQLELKLGEENGKIYCKCSWFMRIQHRINGWRHGKNCAFNWVYV
jgi:hypothetical protein